MSTTTSDSVSAGERSAAVAERDTSGVRPAVVPLVLGLALSGVVAVLAGVAVSRLAIDRSLVVVGVGLVLGGALAMLAATRFAAFLFVLLAIRSALDGLKLTGVGASALGEPGVLVGGVLLLSSGLWLLAQRSAGTLLPPSRSARWLMFFAVASMVAALGSREPVQSMQAASRVLAGALTFVVLEQLLARRPAYVRGLLVAITASLVVPAIVAFGQVLRPGEVYSFTTVSRVSGTFVHPNALAAYLVIVALVALAVALASERWMRATAFAVVAIASVLLLFTYARAAWGALLVGALYLLARRRLTFVWWFLAICVAVAVLVPSIGSRLGDLSASTEAPGTGDANSLEWRIRYWQEILPLVSENPVTGIGLDQVGTRTVAEREPHSGFVQALVETGLLGFVALVGLVVALWRDLATARRLASDDRERWTALAASAVAVGVLLQLFTENLLTQVAIHLYLWIPIAAATSMLVRSRAGDLGRNAPVPTATAVSAADRATSA